jgi:hypothetical protein
MSFDLVFSSLVKNTNQENPSGHWREEVFVSQAHRNRDNYMRRKRIYGGIIDTNSLRMLEEKRDLFYLISFIVHNTKPVGHQVAFVSMSSVHLHYFFKVYQQSNLLHLYSFLSCRILLVWSSLCFF